MRRLSTKLERVLSTRITKISAPRKTPTRRCRPFSKTPQDFFSPYETLSLCSAGFGASSSPSFAAPAPVSLAVFFSRSGSSGFRSVFLSCSSSLSPKLNGSLSSGSGCGATDVRGCHFLPDLPPVFGVACRFVGVGWRYSASASSTGPDLGAAGVGLKRSGFASGRGGFRGGASKK